MAERPDDERPRRVLVVGSSGAGKTTFAVELGNRLNIPVINLDRHYWKPGWQRPPGPQWRREQARVLDAHQAWVADGNYWSTLEIRLTRADTVVFLDLPRWRCLHGALRRLLGNRGSSLQAPGCPERWSWSFLGYIWSYPTHHRPRLLATLAHQATHVRVVTLRTRHEMRAYLTELEPPARGE